MTDYYEILQVHPKADADAIRAAYERLRQRYNPAALNGAADELVELARHRRDEIERAFTVLGAPERRAVYDLELAERVTHAPLRPTARGAVAVEDNTAPAEAADDELLDYRPLPLARRQERSKGFNPQPALPRTQAARRAGRRAGTTGTPAWLSPTLVVVAVTFAVVLITLINTTNTAPVQQAAQPAGSNVLNPGAPTAPAVTPTTAEIVNRFEGQVVAARQVAEQVPNNPNAWVELGNALYDSAVVVHERLGGADDAELREIYVERLPRWLEAAEAYAKALALQPDNGVVRSSRAASLCYFGADTNDQSYVAQGIAEADRALQSNPDEGRVLLSDGLCRVSADPPQTQAALESWQKLVVLPDVNPNLAFQARLLIEQYSR